MKRGNKSIGVARRKCKGKTGTKLKKCMHTVMKGERKKYKFNYSKLGIKRRKK